MTGDCRIPGCGGSSMSCAGNVAMHPTFAFLHHCQVGLAGSPPPGATDIHTCMLCVVRSLFLTGNDGRIVGPDTQTLAAKTRGSTPPGASAKPSRHRTVVWYRTT